MTNFVFHPDTKLDFLRLATRSQMARGLILAALEAASEDDQLLDHLHSYHYRNYGEPDIDIKRWVLASQLGHEVHRLRFFSLEENGYRYRVIYVLDPDTDDCIILAILHRDEIDYDDPTNEFTKRIFAAVQSLGI